MTAFDDAVKAANEKLDARPDFSTDDVATLLGSAGVLPQKIIELTSNPSIVQLIHANPNLAYQIAAQFPATHAIDYYTTREQMGFGYAPTPARPPDFYSLSEGTSDTGAVEYPGGILVDYDQKVVKFPPNNPAVAGSSAWMLQVANWSDEKVKTWRKTLFKMGYLSSAKGGNDPTFQDALKQYQEYRYLYGGGNPIPLDSAGGGPTKEEWGGLTDLAVLKSDAREMYRGIYHTDPDPDEEEYWARKLRQKMLQVARRRDLAPGDAAAVAQAHVHEQFLQDPEVQALRDQQDEQDANTTLRDGIVSIAQTVGA